MLFRLIIVITLVSAPWAFAERSLWTRACDLLLNRHLVATEEMRQVKAALEGEVYRSNKVSAGDRMTIEIKDLEFLEQPTLGVEILPHLSENYKVKKPVDMRIIANPDFLKTDWADESRTMSDSPMLLLYFDNLVITLPGGKQTTVQKLLEEKVTELAAQNPAYNLKTHVSELGNFYGSKVQREFSSQKYFWVTGNTTNGNIKRILLLAFHHAYESLMRDLRYAEKVEAK